MKIQLIDKNLSEKIVEYLFLVLLLATCGSIVYFNFSDIRCSLDPDFASTIYHYMEVIKQGTLNLPNWYHTTSLELDGTMLFAVPLYFVTKNMFVAVGISNILIMLLYVITIGRLLHLYDVERKFIYMTLILVLTPYEYGMLDYFNMMFFNGACYAIKTIVPILLLLIMSMLRKGSYKEKRGKIELIVFGLVYVYLLFATAFSTGIFVILCGILPIFVWMAIEVFIQGTPELILKKEIWIAWIGTFLAFGIGYILHNKVYTAQSRTNMNLTVKGEFANNFRACIGGIYELLGAVTSKDIPVLSVDGIILCVKLVVVTSFLVALFFKYVKFYCDKHSNKMSLGNYTAFIFVWTFIVMFLADMRYPGNINTEYRYFTIGIVPLIILFGLQINNLNQTFNEFQKRFACLVLLAVCAILVYGNYKNVRDKWDRSTYAVELTEYIEAMDVESVIFVSDVDSQILCKAIDNNHKYGCFVPETQSMALSICSYYDSAYGSFYGDRHALVAIQGTDLYGCMPAEIASQYEKVDSFKWFDIYVSNEMLLP